MGKNYRAGVLAGLISSLPLSIFVLVVLLPNVLPWWQSRISSYTSFLELMAFVVLVFVGTMAFVGAISGLIFLATFNKIEKHSTYLKAIFPVVILWSLYLLGNTADLYSSYSAWLDMILLAALVLDAMFFAYLFDRQTKT